MTEYTSRETLLGLSDIREEDVDLPSVKARVRVRSLPAAYSNMAQSEAVELVVNQRGEQTSHINAHKLEATKVLHALVSPKLDSIADADTLSQRWGEAWHELVRKIDEISGTGEESVKRTDALFHDGGAEEERASGSPDPERNGRSDLPVRTGA